MNTYDDERDGHPSRPLPPRLDPRAGRGSSAGAGAPARRHTNGWAVTGRVVGAVLSVLLLAGTGWGWYLGQVADASVTRTDAIPTDGNKDTSGHGAAMNILLVGDDSRDNLTAAQRKQLEAYDDGGSLNTDTMMLLHVPADGSKASFVSFPRDSYVQIPGHGWNKLNAAFAYGYNAAPKSEPEAARESAGQQLLIQTISQLSGLQIDHFVSVDMLGFFNLSNVVGGVEVNVCKATYDPYTHARFPAGVQTLQGTQALLFVRQRHGLPGGDIDRVVRQQTFLAGVARKILSENVMLNPTKQRQLVSAVGKSLTVDQSLDLMQLAQQMQKITAGGVNFQTIPIVGYPHDPKVGDIDKLPSVSTLHQWFANLEASPSATGAPSKATSSAAPKTVAPSKVKVQVFNGSGKSGLAGTTAAALQSAGFVVTSTGNADSSTYTKTEIRYAEGDEGLAATLAAKFPGATTTARDSATSGTVQVVLGSDFTAVGQPLKATAPTGAAAAASSPPMTAADTGCIN